MRLYRGQIPMLATEIVQNLRRAGDIEVQDASVKEAEQDVASVMEEYLRVDYEIMDEARSLLESRGWSYSELGKVKRELAERRNHPLGDSGIRWVAGQIVEFFMLSKHIDEVYADDQMLKRRIMEIFKHRIIDGRRLDREVREQLKNLEEGTSAWNIQYQKVMREVRRKHGLI